MKTQRPLTFRERLLCGLFPSRCLLCQRAVRPEELFCRNCVPRLPERAFLQELVLPLYGKERLPVAAPLAYETGFRRTLQRFKFQDERGLAVPLGWLMAETVREMGWNLDVAAYVPMSEKKLRRRGYNQSQLLAERVAGELGIPCRELLAQVRETETQHELTRPERADNVRGAYRGMEEAAGRRILLVDDIVTTGATLRACAQALYEAGANSVGCLCAARVSPGSLP